MLEGDLYDLLRRSSGLDHHRLLDHLLHDLGLALDNDRLFDDFFDHAGHFYDLGLAGGQYGTCATDAHTL